MATHSIDAIADYLGDKPYFMGAEPVGADATIFAFVAGVPQHLAFSVPIRSAAERYGNLKSYVGRMTARFYPDMKAIAGCPAAE